MKIKTQINYLAILDHSKIHVNLFKKYLSKDGFLYFSSRDFYKNDFINFYIRDLNETDYLLLSINTQYIITLIPIKPFETEIVIEYIS